MDKSPDAFRTISEVADELETPAHVLRFWESRFPQIRPVKRAGGRRYYRPADVALLTGIKRLLHDEGLTIRGVQKILREQGVRHVAGLSGQPVPDDIDMDAEAALEAALAANFGLRDELDLPPEKATTATIVALETALRRSDPKPEHLPTPEPSFNFADLVEDAVQPAELDAGLDFVETEIEIADIVSFRHTAPTDETLALTTLGKTLPAKTPLWPADAPLIQRLRALPPRSLRDRQADLHQLRARLVFLRARLQAPPNYAAR
ncbi:MerR family transcriptional regulator [Cypionkella sp.]|uniref:MerR family transcriptional regulator n=1 Tax=Cypionkella sp. TaxID=2811411 RepID=UPI00262BBC1B|nr:MerR family transcriptional regulator [Cypionkella sp.]MDB5667000.1 MerR family transcriptional regulator [Cypionkella sp.]